MIFGTENVIEWYSNGKVCSATFTQMRHKNKILKLKELHADEVEIHENPDGSILAHFPVSWIKIYPPQIWSPERKECARKRALEKFWGISSPDSSD